MDKFRTMQLAGLLTENQLLEAREDFIAYAMGDKIISAYKKDSGYKPKLSTAIDIIRYLSQHTNTNYIQWIARQYAANQFRLEDVNRIKKEIIEFDRVKPKLVNKDLNSYQDLKSLYNELDKFKEVDITSNKQQEKNVKMEGVTKVIDTPHFKVVIPTTEEAAKFYGKGTKWCTAGDEDNQFAYYNKNDVLYIILAGDRKFQLCMKEDQYVNERDFELERSDIEYLSKYSEYKDFLNMLIKKYYVD
jgi:hypothetical protein